VVSTRRAALAAAPALLLAACGKAGDSGQQADTNVDTGTEKAGDIRLLGDLRAAELEALAASAEPGGARGEAAAVRRSLRRDGDAHVRALEAAMATLGGRVARGEDAPRAFDPAVALAQERRLVALYLDMVPKLADGRARRLAAGIAATHAGAMAPLRLLAGDPPVPEAFVT
jgi:hypothetical protein